MVLGLYYITKGRYNIPEHPVKGEGMTFYSPEEVIIAYNERKVDLHAYIKVRVDVPEEGKLM
jgi:DNA-directed RNA polymerase subunit beta'